jgi:hypothetical protein
LARHSLYSKGNPLDAISHWLIENRYFKNRNPKLQASETPKFLWLLPSIKLYETNYEMVA